MIELLDHMYSANDEQMTYLAKRIIEGSEVTIGYKEEKAWLDKYTERQLGIPFDFAELYLKLGIIECHSGNNDTWERHYLFPYERASRITF
jgi:hypothetical protein